MKTKLLYTLGVMLCTTTVLHLSCKKSDHSFPYRSPARSSQNISVILEGRITDENNLPVSGTTVYCGYTQTTSNADGGFFLEGKTTDASSALVRVEKDGYFTAYRTVFTPKTQKYYVELEMIPLHVSGYFNSVAGGSVDVTGGGSLSFSPNSIVVEATGEPYEGEVSVYAYRINPETENFVRVMPGDLLGLTAGGERVALESFGMLAAELKGTRGEKLQPATGNPATITFPIPPSLMNRAGSDIPLWHFNETAGIWVEEGKAVRRGSEFTGTVSHFSFWNFDAPFPLIEFGAVIMNEDQQPLAFGKVVIASVGSPGYSSGTGTTDDDGNIAGRIPEGIPLEIKIYKSCGDLVYAKEIGTFHRFANLGTITVSSVATMTYHFSGTVTSCAGTPVNSGFVHFYLNGREARTSVTNGSYAFSITLCSGIATADIRAYDDEHNASSNTLSISLADTEDHVTNFSTCNSSSTQYLKSVRQ